MKPTAALAKFIAECSYDFLPPAAVEAAKIAIMDGLAVTVAGSVQSLSTIIGDYTRDLGGSADSSVVGKGFKTNAPQAAFANGVFGHCLDFEIQGSPPTHGTSSCLPTALALGESLRVSGKEIITAYALGWEVQGRMRAATAHATNPAWHPPGLVGPLGGATAGAKVLKLDAEQTHMALGIAASRTGGLTANTGTMVKSTHPGNAARMGAEAAMLAQRGFIATENIFEARHGYAEALFQGDVRWEVLTDGLGDNFRLLEPGFHIKRFPAQIHMQNPTEAVLVLRDNHSVKLDDVQSLHLRTDSCGHSGSLPRSGLDGKFSLEYCAAAALLDGEVNIETFTDARRFKPDMQALLPKVQVDIDAQCTDQTIATVRMNDGSSVSETVEAYAGAMSRPMSREIRMRKVRYCLNTVLSGSESNDLIAMLDELEQVDDVCVLMDAMRGSRAER